MTRLRLLLSVIALFCFVISYADCPSDAKAQIVNLSKQGGQLVVEFSIQGKFEYNIKQVEVVNRSLGGNTIMESISGDMYGLIPGEPYKITWNVKQDVDIIEDIRRSDFLFEFEMTEDACNYYTRWHRVRFGAFASPFAGFTFGNKSASRGLGLSYEFGVYLDKKIGKKSRIGLDVFFARYGMGLDESSNVIFRDETHDMKNIRLRLKSFNFAPSLQWEMGNFNLTTALNFSVLSNGKLKVKADPENGGKDKIKVPIFENTEIFEYASISSPINRFSTGWHLMLDWQDEKKNVSFYIKYGGQFTNMVNQEYWFFQGALESDVLSLRGNSLKFTYIQLGSRWRISNNMVKYKK